MTVTDFLSSSYDTVRKDGLEGANDVLYSCYRVVTSRFSHLDDGDFRAYDRDWDVLIVLDACRADLLSQVAPGFSFLPPVRSVRSAGSTSEEWIEKTFAPQYTDQIAQTAYVTGNPFSDSYLDAADFASLDEVWKHDWDDDLGTIHPDPLTETAIYRWRAGECNRMIVHYMQPHFPSIPRPEFQSGIKLNNVGSKWDSVWEQLRKGRVDEAEVWEAYRENLVYALESVERLVTNIDASKVVVTADHGNSFGSWGLYGHPAAPIDAIRDVPWCELEARNSRNEDIQPPEWAAETGKENSPDEIQQKLRDLGYL